MSDCNGARRHDTAVANSVDLRPYRPPGDGGGDHLSAAVDAVCIDNVGPGSAVDAATVLAAKPHARSLRRAFPATESISLLCEQSTDSTFGERPIAGYQFDGRLRACQATLCRSRSDLSILDRRASSAGSGGDDSVVPAAQEDGPY